MRAARRVLALVLILMASACSADDDPLFVPTDSNFLGTYLLYLVNGGDLPFLAAADGTQRIHVISGKVVLNADRTITDELLFRVSRVDGSEPPTDLVEARTGTYTREGVLIHATFDNAETPTRFDISNGPQLTRSVSSFVMSYRR